MGSVRSQPDGMYRKGENRRETSKSIKQAGNDPQTERLQLNGVSLGGGLHRRRFGENISLHCSRISRWSRIT